MPPVQTPEKQGSNSGHCPGAPSKTTKNMRRTLDDGVCRKLGF